MRKITLKTTLESQKTKVSKTFFFMTKSSFPTKFFMPHQRFKEIGTKSLGIQTSELERNWENNPLLTSFRILQLHQTYSSQETPLLEWLLNTIHRRGCLRLNQLWLVYSNLFYLRIWWKHFPNTFPHLSRGGWSLSERHPCSSDPKRKQRFHGSLPFQTTNYCFRQNAQCNG